MNAAADRYTPTAIALHWLLAAAIVVSFGVGLYMTSLPLSPQRVRLYNWHKWAGVTIFTLSALPGSSHTITTTGAPTFCK